MYSIYSTLGTTPRKSMGEGGKKEKLVCVRNKVHEIIFREWSINE
jgi:hypothetical protein